MRKTVNVKSILSSRGLSVDFRNALYHPHDGHGVSVISSNPFPHKNYDGETIYSCSLKDDGYGILNVIKTDDNGNETLVYPNVGSVDYDLGKITMNPTFYPVVSADVVYAIIITAEPRNQDLFVSENKILRVSRGYADSVNVALEPRMGTV